MRSGGEPASQKQKEFFCFLKNTLVLVKSIRICNDIPPAFVWLFEFLSALGEADSPPEIIGRELNYISWWTETTPPSRHWPYPIPTKTFQWGEKKCCVPTCSSLFIRCVDDDNSKKSYHVGTNNHIFR